MLRADSFKRALPVSWRGMKARNLQKRLRSLKLTLLCGFITILVLRGTVKTGKILNWTEGQETIVYLDEIHDHQRSLAQLDDQDLENIKLPGEDELSDPDLKPESDPGVPYRLGPDIKNWDEQRAGWLEQNPDMKIPEGSRPRILLVTGSQPKPCENPVGDHYLLKSVKNKLDYCRLHNIDIFYNMAHLDQEMAGFWAKLPLLRKLMLTRPEVEWIWWMDSDAMITDMLFELPIERYGDYNMVLHGWDDMVYKKKHWVGLNTGSFLLRNNQWSLDLLDIWAPMGPKGKVRAEAGKLLTATLSGRPEFEADDQSALVYLLATRAEELRPHVFLENSYHLHGYWVTLVEQYEEMMENNHPGLGDERWPFVTHFVGCKPCGTHSDYAVGRCLRQMERAFNFADNQILYQYGLQHRALSSPTVKKIRNDTSTPLKFLGQNFLIPEMSIPGL